MIKIYHHNDADGYAAGYLAGSIYTEEFIRENGIGYISMDYSKTIDINDISEEDIVWIIDYSVEPELMRMLQTKSKEVLWIDHHKSAIEKYEDYDEDIMGIRVDGICGAALVWLYSLGYTQSAYEEMFTLMSEELILEKLYEELEKAPYWLQLVNDWDVWRHKLPETKPFLTSINTKLSTYLFEALDKEDEVNKKSGTKIGARLLKYIEEGKSFIEYRDMWASQFRKKYGFESRLLGIDTYCMNIGNANSEYFGKELDNHDICMTFAYDGRKYTCSIYSNKEYIDCSVIAKYFGGGGHKGAAGFTCTSIYSSLNLFKDDSVLIIDDYLNFNTFYSREKNIIEEY